MKHVARMGLLLFISGCNADGTLPVRTLTDGDGDGGNGNGGDLAGGGGGPPDFLPPGPDTAPTPGRR